jgi:hypothetical protein
MSSWRVALILAAGCAADRVEVADLAGRAAPAPRAIGADEPERGGRMIDLAMAPQTPFSIVQVERLDPAPGGQPVPGAFDVAYTVRPHIGKPAQPEVRARVTCRIHELSLAVDPAPEEVLRGAGETRFTAYFRPDPFEVPPGDCEISFHHRGAPVAIACLRGGVATDGGCDGAPPRAPGPGIAMSEVELGVRDGIVSGSAVLTVGAARTGHAARVRCEDGGRVAAAREASPLPALDGVAPGTSRYVQLTAELAERIGGARSRCEVAIAAGRGEVLARYCVANGRAAAGACAPALGAL